MCSAAGSPPEQPQTPQIRSEWTPVKLGNKAAGRNIYINNKQLHKLSADKKLKKNNLLTILWPLIFAGVYGLAEGFVRLNNDFISINKKIYK